MITKLITIKRLCSYFFNETELDEQSDPSDDQPQSVSTDVDQEQPDPSDDNQSQPVPADVSQQQPDPSEDQPQPVPTDFHRHSDPSYFRC